MRSLAIWLLFFGASLAQDQCVDKLVWTAEKQRVFLNGRPFRFKGISWFGFETDTYAPHGLWSVSLDYFLDTLASNNFNAIRFPYSLKMVRDNPSKVNVDCGQNPDICHLNALDLISAVIDKAAERGILILLDNQLPGPGEAITELWFNDEFSEADVLQLWRKLLAKVGDKWNVFAIDLKNEPHGAATWGYLHEDTDWDTAAARFIKDLSKVFGGLFFVEGISEKASTPNTNQVPHFWGENLEGVTWHPVDAGDSNLNKRIVYSPHVYGPDVSDMPYFDTSQFPGNMADIWRAHFAYVPAFNGQPVVIGEWGGHYAAGSKDETWANTFYKYLIDNCLTDNFYWCLNPNGGDTGGLFLDDWKTLDQRKVQLLHDTQPNPSKVKKNGNQFCITYGSYPNSKCN